MNSWNSFLIVTVLSLTLLLSILFYHSTSHAFNPDDTYFSDVTGEAGVPGESYGARGVCWGDYNNDGYVDFYISSSYGDNILYRNNGNGTFTDATYEAGVSCPTASNGVAWGDYDNDGLLDLYVSNYDYNNLFRNNGDGTFTDVTWETGVGDYGPGEAVNWVDYDKDGFLDIYIVNGGAWWYSNVLYRNNGDGSFSDVTIYAGVEDYAQGENSAWADYDNDGFQDLYVSNRGRNSLYRNNGDGTFTDVTTYAGVGDYGKGHGISWGDYNNDGLLDLYLVNRQSANLLYRNNGDGTFTNVAAEAGVDDDELYTVGTSFLDFDNDGDLDIYNVSGAVNRLFSNDGDGMFTDVTDSAGVADYGRLGNGMACGDYNNDGFLDIYVVNWEYGCVLFKNNLSQNNWIQLKLIGTTSNSMAVGTRVDLHIEDNVQIREVDGGSGFLSQNSSIVQFGLGGASFVDQIVITWPSGIVTTLEDVEANQLIVVEESGEIPPLTVELIPEETEYSPGDTVQFTVILANNTNRCLVFDGWLEAILPDGTPIIPLRGPYEIRLFPMSTYDFLAYQIIPLFAPEGEYVCIGKVGDFPEVVVDEDSFVISVTNHTIR
ncbi:MAG: CRTAC1 family protein [Candidatus Zixiibacteriota bacterium]